MGRGVPRGSTQFQQCLRKPRTLFSLAGNGAIRGPILSLFGRSGTRSRVVFAAALAVGASSPWHPTPWLPIAAATRPGQRFHYWSSITDNATLSTQAIPVITHISRIPPISPLHTGSAAQTRSHPCSCDFSRQPLKPNPPWYRVPVGGAAGKCPWRPNSQNQRCHPSPSFARATADCVILTVPSPSSVHPLYGRGIARRLQDPAVPSPSPITNRRNASPNRPQPASFSADRPLAWSPPTRLTLRARSLVSYRPIDPAPTPRSRGHQAPLFPKIRSKNP
jgi:hypothetical protein